MCCCSTSDLILYIVAMVFPPIAVLLRSGFWSQDFLLNVLLTLCGFLPGMLHAFYYISITSPLRNSEYGYFYQSGWDDREREGGMVREQGSNDATRPLLQDSKYGAQQPIKAGAKKNSKTSVNNPPPYSETS